MDTSGSEQYKAINERYYQRADCFLLVYDITNKSSFEECREYYNKTLIDRCRKKVRVILLGNKSDLEEKRVIKSEEGANFALENGFLFMETSCLKNTNVAKAFEELIIEAMSHIKNESEDKLGFQDNYNVKHILGKEQVLFSDKITKKQIDTLLSKALFVEFLEQYLFVERNIVVTDLAVYTFNGYEIRRRIKIEDLKGITISTTSDQFILHCNQNEYDELFIYPDRKKISKVLQSVYNKKTNEDLLFCKKTDKDLSKFVVGKKERPKNPYLFKINQNELTVIKKMKNLKPKSQYLHHQNLNHLEMSPKLYYH